MATVDPENEIREAYEAWRVRRLTQEEGARLLGVHERTFRRYIDRYEEAQLRHDALIAGVREALTKSGLDPVDLDLEITESKVMHDSLRAGQVLEEIDALGAQRIRRPSATLGSNKWVGTAWRRA